MAIAPRKVNALLQALDNDPALKSFVQNQTGATELTNDRIIQLIQSPANGVIKQRIQAAISMAVFSMQRQIDSVSDQQQKTYYLQLLKDLISLEKATAKDTFQPIIVNDPGLMADVESEKRQKDLEKKIENVRNDLIGAQKEVKEKTAEYRLAKQERLGVKQKLEKEADKLEPEKRLTPAQQENLLKRYDQAKEKGLVTRRQFELAERQKGHGTYIDALNENPEYHEALTNYANAQQKIKILKSELQQKWEAAKEQVLEKSSHLKQLQTQYKKEFGDSAAKNKSLGYEEVDLGNLFNEEQQEQTSQKTTMQPKPAQKLKEEEAALSQSSYKSPMPKPQQQAIDTLKISQQEKPRYFNQKQLIVYLGAASASSQVPSWARDAQMNKQESSHTRGLGIRASR